MFENLLRPCCVATMLQAVKGSPAFLVEVGVAAEG